MNLSKYDLVLVNYDIVKFKEAGDFREVLFASIALLYVFPSAAGKEGVLHH